MIDGLRSLPSIIEYEVEIRRVANMDDLLLKVEIDEVFSVYDGRIPQSDIERK